MVYRICPNVDRRNLPILNSRLFNFVDRTQRTVNSANQIKGSLLDVSVRCILESFLQPHVKYTVAAKKSPQSRSCGIRTALGKRWTEESLSTIPKSLARQAAARDGCGLFIL